MRVEAGGYEVVSLDADGCELGTVASDTLRDARRYAKLRVTCQEDIEAGMVKVEIQDRNGACVADYFVKKIQDLAGQPIAR